MVVTRKGIIHWNLGYCKQSDMGTMYWTVMSIHHRLKSGLEIVLARYRPESVRVAGQLKVILVQWWERAAQGMKTETAKEAQGGWKEMGHRPCRSISLEFWIYLAWQCGSDIDGILQLFGVHRHVAHLQEEGTEEGANKGVNKRENPGGKEWNRKRSEGGLFCSFVICTKLSLPPIWAGSPRLDH